MVKLIHATHIQGDSKAWPPCYLEWREGGKEGVGEGKGEGGIKEGRDQERGVGVGGIEGGEGSRDQPPLKLIRFSMETYLEVKQYIP